MFFDYTAQLRTFFENLPVNQDQSLPHRVVIANGREQLFDFVYPIFDEDYRAVFETNFIRFFYTREIGFETFGLFKFQLETWLLINMPYWNKMFESALLDYDPFSNYKMDETHTKNNNKTQNENRNIINSKTKSGIENKTIDGETNATSNRTGTTASTEESNIVGNSDSVSSKTETGSVTDDNFARNLESTNPDSRLALTASDGEGVIEYASSIKEDTENNTKATTINGNNTTGESSNVDSASKSSANVSDNLTDNSTSAISQIDTIESNETDTKDDTKLNVVEDVEDYVSSKIGKIGNDSFSTMLQEYRSTLMRVERQIFNEMNELFMLVY